MICTIVRYTKLNVVATAQSEIVFVITIIILLILAGVAISMITGGEGLFAQANGAATKYNQAAKNEAELLNSILNNQYFTGLLDFELSASVTETTITIRGSTTGNGTVKYKYALLETPGKIDWGGINAITDTSKVFTGLTKGKTYYTYMMAIDEEGFITMAKNNGLSVTTWTSVPSFEISSNVKFTFTPDEVINPDIYNNGLGVKVDIKDNTNSGYQIEYKIEKMTDWANYIPGTTEIYVNKYNETVLARLKDMTNTEREEGTYGTANVTNIDILAPEGFSYTLEEKTETTITISGSTNDTVDEEKSASSSISYKYAIQETEGEPNWSTVTATNTIGQYQFTGLTAGKTYYVYMVAIDEAGNMTKARNEDNSVTSNPHSYSWVTTTAATHSNPGESSYKCSECGNVRQTQVIPAQGHTDSCYNWTTQNCSFYRLNSYEEVNRI